MVDVNLATLSEKAELEKLSLEYELQLRSTCDEFADAQGYRDHEEFDAYVEEFFRSTPVAEWSEDSLFEYLDAFTESN